MLADPDMFGFMVVVRLPDNVPPANMSINTIQSEKPHYDENHAEKIQDALYYDYKVEVWNIQHLISLHECTVICNYE